MVDGLAGYTMLAPITIQYSRSICYLFRQRINFTSNCLKTHSNSYTRLGFDTVAVTYSLIGASVDDFLLHRLPGGGTVMEGWVRDFQDAALDAVR